MLLLYATPNVEGKFRVQAYWSRTTWPSANDPALMAFLDKLSQFIFAKTMYCHTHTHTHVTHTHTHTHTHVTHTHVTHTHTHTRHTHTHISLSLTHTNTHTRPYQEAHGQVEDYIQLQDDDCVRAQASRISTR